MAKRCKGKKKRKTCKYKPKWKLHKNQALIIHAQRRAQERYGIFMFNSHYAVELIQEGKGYCLKKQSNARSEWIIEYNGQDVRVIYDKNRKRIVTVLPPLDENVQV